MSLLEVQGLKKHFGGIKALEDLSFAVEEREIHGLIGPNGAGKTTALRVISGSYRPTAARIIYQGQEIAGQPAHRVAGRGLVRTFQELALFQQLTVFESVLVGCHLTAKSNLFDYILRGGGHKERAAIQRSEEILEFMGLADRRDELSLNLPLGSQRALGIAIALAARPSLLMLDEPFAGMNARETDETMDLVRRVRESGVTMILVEHDMKAVMGLCDRITVLNFGELLARGKPDEIRSNPDVIHAYLGTA